MLNSTSTRRLPKEIWVCVPRSCNYYRTKDWRTEWCHHRTGRITSTYVKEVTTAIQTNSAGKELRSVKLAHEMIKPPDLSSIGHIHIGKSLEPEGSGIFCERFTGRRSGGWWLIIHPKAHWFAASRDWYVWINDASTHTCTWTLLEVKNYHATKSLENSPYFRYGSDRLTLNSNHAHSYQVQSALAASDLTNVTFSVTDQNHFGTLCNVWILIATLQTGKIVGFSYFNTLLRCFEASLNAPGL